MLKKRLYLESKRKIIFTFKKVLLCKRTDLTTHHVVQPSIFGATDID